MDNRMRGLLLSKKALFGFAISVVCIVLIATRVEFGALSQAFLAADYWIVAPVLIVYLSGYLVRTLRWQVMLHPLKAIPFRNAFEVIMIAWAANNMLPARLGEFIRAYLIGRSESISRSASFATVVLERILDGLTLIGGLVVIVILYPFPGWVAQVEVVGVVVFLAALMFFIGLLRWRDPTLALTRWFTRRLPDTMQDLILSILQKFISGLEFMAQGARGPLFSVLYSVSVWSIELVCYWAVMQAVHLDVPAYAALFVLVIVNLAIIIPSSPGYIGTFQASAMLALAVFHVDANAALSFALLLHAIQFIPVTLIGVFFLHRRGFSVERLQEEAAV